MVRGIGSSHFVNLDVVLHCEILMSQDILLLIRSTTQFSAEGHASLKFLSTWIRIRRINRRSRGEASARNTVTQSKVERVVAIDIVTMEEALEM